jgi:anti-sigma factor RsiW
MKPPITESNCSKTALLEFLEGELTPQQELEIASHIETCTACQIEVEQQRNLAAKLDDSFGELPEIPADFSKIVSANARSQVSAIRRPYERRTAVLVCIGLATLLAIAFGPLNAVVGPTIIFEKVLSAVAVAVSLISDLVLGLVIVGRAVSTSLGISPLIILGLVAGSVLIFAVRRNQRSARVSAVGRSNR